MRHAVGRALPPRGLMFSRYTNELIALFSRVQIVFMVVVVVVAPDAVARSVPCNRHRRRRRVCEPFTPCCTHTCNASVGTDKYANHDVVAIDLIHRLRGRWVDRLINRYEVDGQIER